MTDHLTTPQTISNRAGGHAANHNLNTNTMPPNAIASPHKCPRCKGQMWQVDTDDGAGTYQYCPRCHTQYSTDWVSGWWDGYANARLAMAARRAHLPRPVRKNAG